MSATLVALTDGPDLVLDKPVMLLGRHGECDVQLHSGKVSRRHCIIATVDDKLVIRDLGSTNGVRINGEQVPEGPLCDGDEVAIGNFCYRVRVGIGAEPKHAVRPKRVLDDAALEAADAPIPLTEARDSQVMMAKKPDDDSV
jgi:predicted component of type VI protein secretion system